MKSMEPNLEKSRIVRLFDETLEMMNSQENIDEMSPDVFCKMILKNKLGK